MTKDAEQLRSRTFCEVINNKIAFRIYIYYSTVKKIFLKIQLQNSAASANS
jgi:hypothetical protein